MARKTLEEYEAWRKWSMATAKEREEAIKKARGGGALSTLTPEQAMAKLLESLGARPQAGADVSEIVHQGNQIVLPEGMTYGKAIDDIARWMEHDEEETLVEEFFDGYPWDAAWALEVTISEIFGWQQGKPTVTMFGKIPPERRKIEIGLGETAYISVGQFTIPGIEGTFSSGPVYTRAGLQMGYQLMAEVKRKDEHLVKKLADRTREYMRDHSLYQGQAIKMRFTRRGEALDVPQLNFIDVSQATESRLIFSKEVYNQIADSLYTPIERRDKLALAQIPFRRGVLLTGTYGTGKTETAFVAGGKAIQHGITFLYCEQAQDFPQAVLFAQRYAPCVVFIEDIDRVASGERDEMLNGILNSMDGIEAKSHEVMIVLTTNDAEAINEAMIRPGRLDVVIEVAPPDAEAVTRLIQMYGRGLVPAGAKLERIGTAMSGQIPAVIREVVERAKLGAIRATDGHDLTVTEDNLLVAARTMENQVKLLSKRTVREPSDAERAAEVVAGGIADGLAVVAAALSPVPDLDGVTDAKVRQLPAPKRD